MTNVPKQPPSLLPKGVKKLPKDKTVKIPAREERKPSGN